MIVRIVILAVAPGNYAPRTAVVRTRRNDRILVVISARFGGQQTLIVAEHGVILGVGERSPALDQSQRGPALRRQFGDVDYLCVREGVVLILDRSWIGLLHGRRSRRAIYEDIIAA